MAHNTYVLSLRSNLERCKSELKELREILEQRPLSNPEYRAAERSLQVSINASIGIAKHWAKSLAGHSPTDACQAFEIFAQQSKLPIHDLQGWRKIIGLRNVLVHDYLNIDPEIVCSVILEKHTDSLFSFSEKGLTALAKD